MELLKISDMTMSPAHTNTGCNVNCSKGCSGTGNNCNTGCNGNCGCGS